MKLLISMFLVCAACGPAFTYASVDEALTDDAGAATDTGGDTEADASPELDAQSEARADAQADVGVTPDAAQVDAAAPDSAPVCTPFALNTTGLCYGGGAVKTANIPAQFCDTTPRTTPPECADCQEHYTCACISAANSWCAGNPITCAVDNGVPTITCN